MKSGSLETNIYLWKNKNISEVQGNLQQNRDTTEIEQPDFNFNYEKALKFLISYTELLPKSVMPRLIVKMNQDIKDNPRWRTGVMLENRALKSSAVIKSDEDARKIYIAVNGEQQRDYFAIILNNIRIINNSFTNLNVVERVPLPDNPNITVSYRQLIDYEIIGEHTIIPEGTRERYYVRELLGNVFVENIIETKIPGDIVMGDKYIYSSGQVIGAQGQNAQATFNIQNFNQVWQENRNELDLSKLAEDLSKLKAAIKQEAESSEQFESLTNVVHAQEAATNNDGPRTLEYLSKAGKWALGIAINIGVEVAATALSKSLGLN